MQQTTPDGPNAQDLVVHEIGRPRRPSVGRAPVQLAHGFTQNHRCWGPFAAELAAARATSAADLPGHGSSGHDDADLTAAGRLLATACHGHVLVGYSMGGRIALHSALQALEETDSIRGLVLIGTTAGIVDASERSARRERDAQLAADLERDPAAFIDRWLALPMFSGLGPAVQFRSERLTNRVDGMAATLRHRGTGSQAPLHNDLSALGLPTLLLAGEHDTKFRQEAQHLREAIGTGATVAIVDDSGHACHLERPNETAGVLLDWLDRHGL